MAFALVPWYFILGWAIFATTFYYFRYRKTGWMKNPWLVLGIFVLNIYFFAYAAVLFVASEGIRYQMNKDEKKSR